jgi:DNA-binding MarR family transcriptional regulator
MKTNDKTDISIGTKAFILSKLYYGVLSKNLESLGVERYYAILHFIYNNSGCTQQHICNNLAIDKTAMVKVLDYLIEAEFVQRHKNPEDRREHFITLTKKGIAQTSEIVSSFAALDDEIFSGISSKAKQNFITILHKVSGNLRQMPANNLVFNYTKTGKTNKTQKLTENKLHQK